MHQEWRMHLEWRMQHLGRLGVDWVDSGFRLGGVACNLSGACIWASLRGSGLISASAAYDGVGQRASSAASEPLGLGRVPLEARQRALAQVGCTLALPSATSRADLVDHQVEGPRSHRAPTSELRPRRRRRRRRRRACTAAAAAAAAARAASPWAAEV